MELNATQNTPKHLRLQSVTSNVRVQGVTHIPSQNIYTEEFTAVPVKSLYIF